MAAAQEQELEPRLKVRMVSPVYFCATKLEAFARRGKEDFQSSRDLEDFIAVVDGRAELVGEIRTSSAEVRSYLTRESTKLLLLRPFLDALPGHLPPDAASQERVATVISRLREIAQLQVAGNISNQNCGDFPPTLDEQSVSLSWSKYRLRRFLESIEEFSNPPNPNTAIQADRLNHS